MSRMKFADVTFPSRQPTEFELEARLQRFLKKRRLAALPAACSSDELEDARYIDPEDRARIKRRVKAYLGQIDQATGMAHLSREARSKLEIIRNGVDLIPITSEAQADEIAAALHEDMPWMAPATERVWHDLRRCVREGRDGAQVRPMLIVGSPGTGKSFWARRLAELIGVPYRVVEAASEPAGFSIAGSQHGWSSASPGKPVDTILRHRIGNTMVIVDEVEKAGAVHATNGTPHRLADALLPLLEPSTAERWECPYFRVRFDMSRVSWIMTANRVAGLPEPLLSRCPPLFLESLTKEHLIAFAGREGRRRKLPAYAVTSIQVVLESVGSARPSLRTVMRMIERAESVCAMPTLH